LRRTCATARATVTAETARIVAAALFGVYVAPAIGVFLNKDGDGVGLAPAMTLQAIPVDEATERHSCAHSIRRCRPGGLSAS